MDLDHLAIEVDHIVDVTLRFWHVPALDYPAARATIYLT
jgi:hypothetical protein